MSKKYNLGIHYLNKKLISMQNGNILAQGNNTVRNSGEAFLPVTEFHVAGSHGTKIGYSCSFLLEDSPNSHLNRRLILWNRTLRR